MCAARFSGCLNGCADEAAGGAAGAAGPVTASRMLDWTEAGPRILHSLEMGTVMTIFYQKKSQRPERRTFQIRQDTRQIVWSRNPDKIEGEVDIREIRELRLGKGSRDFERYPEEARKLDSAHCFIVLYGLEFRLRTLSVAAFSEEEVNMWITGLNWLMIDTQRAPAPQQIDRWLRKQFEVMDRNHEGSRWNVELKRDPDVIKEHVAPVSGVCADLYLHTHPHPEAPHITHTFSVRFTLVLTLISPGFCLGGSRSRTNSLPSPDKEAGSDAMGWERATSCLL